MENDASILITMTRALDQNEIDYRVLMQPAGSGAKSSAGKEFASIQLNRRICLPDGQFHSIVHQGGFFSIDSELRGAASTSGVYPITPPASDKALAFFRHERTRLFAHRNVLILSAHPERRYLLRRRSWFGSPANVDVVALSTEPSSDPHGMLKTPTRTSPVLLRAEKAGAWRQRLLAQWLEPDELPAPIMLFVLNVLADLDHRAAVAASAGAIGL